LAIFFVMALASTAQAQIFDQLISNLLRPNNCDPSISPTGNLSNRICNIPAVGGSPGASGGSTTSLSRESAPIEEERKVARKIGPLNLYISGEYERFDKDVTTFEPGYKTDTGRALIGADYSFSDWLVFGGAFKYSRDEGKFDAQPPAIPVDPPGPPLPIPRGRFNTDSYGGLLHVGFVPAQRSFVDAIFGYTRKNYFIRRGVAVTRGTLSATGTADGDPDGDEFKAELNGGYDFSFQNITIGPRLGLHFRRTEIDGYTERGRLVAGVGSRTGLELIYDPQHENSLTTALGVYGSVAISTGIGVLVPQTTLEYVHEFLDPQRRITFRFIDDLNRTAFRFENDPPDRNYFNLGAGIVLVLPHGISPFVNYRSLVGYKDQSSHTVTAGLRVEF
jgi:outer membrane autotransporter protein